MKKFFSLLLSSIILITSLSTINTNAKIIENSLAKELLELNDSSWNEFFKDVDLNSEEVVKTNIYLKVYEDPYGGQILDKKAYTKKEYLSELKKPKQSATYDLASWLQVSCEIYPMYNNPDKASILVSYQWLQMPRFQQKEIFTVSADSNILFPGENDRVNASFWPNIACPNVVGSYNNFSTPSKFEFDPNGITFIQAMNTTEFNDLIKQQPNWEEYFSTNPYHDILGTKGNPKGTLGFIINRATSNTLGGKITFTYNHQQISINFDPNVEIDLNGNVSIKGGLTAGIGFDKATTTISYTWGSIE